MSEKLAPYNEVILQILIALVLVCAIIVIFFTTVKYIYKTYLNAKFLYEEHQKGKGAILEMWKKESKTNAVRNSILTAIGAGIILIVMAFVANRIFGLEIAASSEKIILTFVGILATFIVITNYAQVSDMKKDVDDRFEQIDRTMSTLTRHVFRLKQREREQLNPEDIEDNND